MNNPTPSSDKATLTPHQLLAVVAAGQWLQLTALQRSALGVVKSMRPIGQSGAQVAVLSNLLEELSDRAEQPAENPLTNIPPESAPSERIRACAEESKRLDWLQGRLGKGGFKAATSEPDGCCSLVCREVHTVEGDLRAAIDAAMADSPASPGGASR